jgi:hypothetical protein
MSNPFLTEAAEPTVGSPPNIFAAPDDASRKRHAVDHAAPPSRVAEAPRCRVGRSARARRRRFTAASLAVAALAGLLSWMLAGVGDRRVVAAGRMARSDSDSSRVGFRAEATPRRTIGPRRRRHRRRRRDHVRSGEARRLTHRDAALARSRPAPISSTLTGSPEPSGLPVPVPPGSPPEFM